jgi:hypothetical protein
MRQQRLQNQTVVGSATNAESEMHPCHAPALAAIAAAEK